MQEKEIKLLFKAGVFDSCQAIPVSMSRGWTLKFITRDQEVVTLNLQRSKRGTGIQKPGWCSSGCPSNRVRLAQRADWRLAVA